MKMFLAGLVLILIVGTNAQWYNFPAEAGQGAAAMWEAYQDMKDANWKNSDKYFHARGNYDAAEKGPGGRWAAEKISDFREWTDRLRGQTVDDSATDQIANRWGRDGNDPNHFRPEGLPDEY